MQLSGLAAKRKASMPGSRKAKTQVCCGCICWAAAWTQRSSSWCDTAPSSLLWAKAKATKKSKSASKWSWKTSSTKTRSWFWKFFIVNSRRHSISQSRPTKFYDWNETTKGGIFAPFKMLIFPFLRFSNIACI